MPAAASLGRLLVELGLDDKGFKDGLKQAEANLKAASGSIQSFADSVQRTLVTALKAGSAAVAGFGAAATVVGSGFEQAMAEAAAKTGATAAEMTALEAKARELGKATLFTATQAAEGLTELIKAGLTSGQAIDASADALAFAGSQAISMADSSSLLVATLKQFGLEASDSGRIVDVFSKAVNASLLSANELNDVMKYAGPVGAAFGMTLEEVVGGVAAFRDLGFEATLAGNAFKMALLEAVQATDAKTEALARLGLTMADINPETHSFAEMMETVAATEMGAADAAQVFGVRAGPAIAAVLNQVRAGTLDIEVFSGVLRDSAGTTEAAYQTLLGTVRSQGLITVSALQDLLIETFQVYAAPLADLLSSLPGVLNAAASGIKAAAASLQADLARLFGDLQAWITANADQIAQAFVDAARAGVVLVGVLAKIGPHLVTIGQIAVTAFVAVRVTQFATAVAGVASTLIAVTTGATSFGAAILAMNPALLLVAVGVGALALALNHFAGAASDAEASARAMASPSTAIPRLQAQYEALTDEAQKLHATLDTMSTSHKLSASNFVAATEDRIAAIGKEQERLNRLIEQNRVRAETEAAATAADAEAKAKQERVALDLQTRLSLLDQELSTEARAMKETAAATDEAAKAVRTLDEELEPLSAMFDALPSTTDRVAELVDQVDDLAPPKTLSRLDQLGLLFGDLSMEAARSEENALALGEAIDRTLNAALSEMMSEATAAGETVRQAFEGELLPALEEGLATLEAMGAPSLWSRIGDAAQGAFAAIGASALAMGQSALGVLTGAFGGFNLGSLMQLAGETTGEDAETSSRAAARAAVNELVSGAITFVEALAENLPVVIQTLVARVPDIIDALVKAIPTILITLANQLPVLLTSIVNQLPVLIKALLDALPGVIQGLIDTLPGLIKAIVAAIPDIIIAIVEALPDIIVALVQLVPVVVVALVSAIVTELLPRLPEIAWALIKSIGELIADLGKLLGEALLSVLPDWIYNPDKEKGDHWYNFGDTPGVLRAGGTQTASFAPGDYFASSRSIEGLLGQVLGAVQGLQPAGGLRSATVPVFLDGRLAASASVNAADLGRAPRLRGALRAGVGVRYGLDRRR